MTATSTWVLNIVDEFLREALAVEGRVCTLLDNHETLYVQSQALTERETAPHAAIIYSQNVKSAETIFPL
jgi:hypothetical protein